ncbi:hypothetical protein TWF718_005339 [Orbilia javanica]|uniref:Uncharacterized protein n=1 Tax=Orbilia javanica TaxID=47235 RepID=A0AAN8RJB6_9PEZI
MSNPFAFQSPGAAPPPTARNPMPAELYSRTPVNPALPATPSLQLNKINTRPLDMMKTFCGTGYSENVDKADFERYKNAKGLETSSSVAWRGVGGLSSQFNNEEKKIPSASRTQENQALKTRSSTALELAARLPPGPVQSGQGSKPAPEYSFLTERYSQSRPENQTRPTPSESQFIGLSQDFSAQLKAFQESRERLRMLMQETQRTLSTSEQTRQSAPPVAELEGTPVTKYKAKRETAFAIASTGTPSLLPQELEQKSVPTKQLPQVFSQKSTARQQDPYFNQRSEYHLQEWMKEIDKGDIVTAAEHLKVIENMIIEKWGSINSAPKHRIATFTTYKIISLLRYKKDQEALQLAKHIESLYSGEVKGRSFARHLAAEIVLYIRLKDWDTAKMKCARFLQPETLEGISKDPRASDKIFGFWLMSKVLKGSGKYVEAKFYKSQVNVSSLESYGWYKWADPCLRSK